MTAALRRLKVEKNMKSKIVVDSSANVYELPDVGFACVPLKILTDEQEYVDTAEVDAPALAQMMRTYKGRTSTSCPNISDWLTAYEGADEVYVVTIPVRCPVRIMPHCWRARNTSRTTRARGSLCWTACPPVRSPGCW